MRLASRLSTPKQNQFTTVLERPKRTPKIKVLTRELQEYIMDSRLQRIEGSLCYSIKFAYREKKGHKKESSIHN